MSDEKYYVEDLLTQGAWLGKDIYGVISGGYLKESRSTFTKTELSEYNNGALYKRKWRDLRNDRLWRRLEIEGGLGGKT